jgi:rare lipoprotein A
MVLLAGCAARRPVSSQPPSPPAPASAETIDAAKRSTNVPEPTAGPAPPVAPSVRQPPAITPPSSGYSEEGNASWYGNPFHGRRSSNGEVYDMNKFTAAHRTLPFDTVVRVTNLNNGKSTVVRITDRGPFVGNRIIDLSRAAAAEIESVGPGVVPVRIEVLTPGIDPASGFFTVQVGAFRDRDNADRLSERLSATYSPVTIVRFDTDDGPFYRVRVGKIAGEDAARQMAEKLRSREGFSPLVFRLDEETPPGGAKR